MAPKRKAETAAAENAGTTHSGSETAPGPPKAAKKSKAKEPVTPLDPAQPTNKQLPDVLGPYEKGEGMTRMTCWNIAGYNASVKKVGSIQTLTAALI